MGAWQIALRAMCETSKLGSTQAACLIEIKRKEKPLRNPACMKAKGIMYVYERWRFYTTSANSGKIDASLPKH